MARRTTISVGTLARWSVIGVGLVALAMALIAASDAAVGFGLGYNWNDVGLYAGTALWTAIILMICSAGLGGDRNG